MYKLGRWGAARSKTILCYDINFDTKITEKRKQRRIRRTKIFCHRKDFAKSNLTSCKPGRVKRKTLSKSKVMEIQPLKVRKKITEKCQEILIFFLHICGPVQPIGNFTLMVVSKVVYESFALDASNSREKYLSKKIKKNSKKSKVL